MGGERRPGTTEVVQKFQLSGGPMGRLVLVGVFSIIAIAVIAWSAADVIKFFCLLAVTGLAFFSIARILSHAKENPVNASLDGAEVTRYQQYLGTKGEPRILPSELVTDAVRSSSTKGGTTDRPAETLADPAQSEPEPPSTETATAPVAPGPESDTESGK